MSDQVSIEYRDSGLKLDVATSDPTAEDISYRKTLKAPYDDVVRSLYELRNVLSDEPTWLIRFREYHVTLKTRPRDDESVDLVFDGRDERETAVRASKTAFCESFIEAARSYHEDICGPDKQDDYKQQHCAELSLVVDDAAGRLEYYREHGTQQGYEPTAERGQVERFARYGHKERFRELVLQTGELKPFVRDLAQRDDDELAHECYENLLGFYEEVAATTAEALADAPDERARNYLFGVLWSEMSGTPQVLRALKQIPNEDVIENATGLLGYDTYYDDAGAVRLAVAKLLRDVDLPAYLDDRGLSQVERRLEKILRKADREDVREACRAALDSLDRD